MPLLGMAEQELPAYPGGAPGKTCRVICAGQAVNPALPKKKRARRAERGPPGGRDYLNRDSTACGAWFAMERAWTPSCCLVCSDWRVALSLARSASTRLPTPAVIVSCSLPTKVMWFCRAVDDVPSLARAAETLLIDVSSVVSRFEAEVADANVAVGRPCDRVPDQILLHVAPGARDDLHRTPGAGGREDVDVEARLLPGNRPREP